MTWQEGKDVTFENGLVEDFDNYKIDEHLYKEIPEYPEAGWLELASITAIRKSSKLSIRQSARIAHSVQRFDKKSTILTGIMILIIFLQLIVLVVQLTTLHFWLGNGFLLSIIQCKQI